MYMYTVPVFVWGGLHAAPPLPPYPHSFSTDLYHLSITRQLNWSVTPIRPLDVHKNSDLNWSTNMQNPVLAFASN